MNTVRTLLHYVPKRAAFFSLLGLGVLAPVVSFAWGPSRDTYTIAKPADHVTFNSITDNPNIGDERNFVSIREDGSTGTWKDSVTAEAGKTYVVRLYVHNNAAANLNLTAHNVTAKVNLPTTTAKSIDVFGYIDSSNATPKEVYDQATFTAPANFNLAYQSGSLKYENNHFTDGVGLPESIFTSTGAKLGYSSLNGDIKGCLQYAGYVTFKVKPQFAKTTTTTPSKPAPAEPTPAQPATSNFTVKKQVSKHGANTWSDSYAAQPGETVDFRIDYKNTSTTVQNNVTFKDTLPTNLTYVANSSSLGVNTTSSGQALTDTLTSTGITVGNIKAGDSAWMQFSATVANASAFTCNAQTSLTNNGSVTTGGTTKSDSAAVTVTNHCVTPAPTQPTTPTTPTTPQTPVQPEQPTQPSQPQPAQPEVQPVAAVTPQPAPAPLPSTGPTEIIGGVIGSSSLGLGLHYYLASRRALRNAQV